jgi:hypothetical protein
VIPRWEGEAPAEPSLVTQRLGGCVSRSIIRLIRRQDLRRSHEDIRVLSDSAVVSPVSRRADRPGRFPNRSLLTAKPQPYCRRGHPLACNACSPLRRSILERVRTVSYVFKMVGAAKHAQMNNTTLAPFAAAFLRRIFRPKFIGKITIEPTQYFVARGRIRRLQRFWPRVKAYVISNDVKCGIVILRARKSICPFDTLRQSVDINGRL